TWFGRSRVPSLHLALARLRAIEHRRFLVHATNTGVTAVVDPAGRVVAELSPNRPASTVATVRWMRGWTLYERIGSAPAWAAAAVAAIMMIRRRGGIRQKSVAGE
ncbi:MAG: apolipoprotein N-acyltransferase, partial [Myxococcota bacterium]|nr:apolipoprotein N-acyltransferase [Myxococcota bacterium]